MTIKIKLIRDTEPVYSMRECQEPVPAQSPDHSDLVLDREQLKIRRKIQLLRAEIRQQEIAELKRKYNL